MINILINIICTCIFTWLYGVEWLNGFFCLYLGVLCLHNFMTIGSYISVCVYVDVFIPLMVLLCSPWNWPMACWTSDFDSGSGHLSMCQTLHLKSISLYMSPANLGWNKKDAWDSLFCEDLLFKQSLFSGLRLWTWITGVLGIIAILSVIFNIWTLFLALKTRKGSSPTRDNLYRRRIAANRRSNKFSYNSAELIALKKEKRESSSDTSGEADEETVLFTARLSQHGTLSVR